MLLFISTFPSRLWGMTLSFTMPFFPTRLEATAVSGGAPPPYFRYTMTIVPRVKREAMKAAIMAVGSNI